MVAKRKTRRAKSSGGKTQKRSALVVALSRITGLSAKDIRTELTLLARPVVKKSGKKARKSS